MAIITPYIHQCVIQDGDMAGNKHSQPVGSWDIEAQEECLNCGEPLATPLEIITHIYRELTE